MLDKLVHRQWLYRYGEVEMEDVIRDTHQLMRSISKYRQRRNDKLIGKYHPNIVLAILRSQIDEMGPSAFGFGLDNPQTEKQAQLKEVALLKQEIAELRRTLLGFQFQAGLELEIEPPGDFDKYPFSEN